MFIDRILSSKSKVLVVGLRTATQEEISEYKRQLRKHGIKYKHVTEGSPYNGILKIYK